MLRLNVIHFARTPTEGICSSKDKVIRIVKTKECICYVWESKSVCVRQKGAAGFFHIPDISVNKFSVLLELSDQNLLGITSAEPALLAAGQL